MKDFNPEQHLNKKVDLNFIKSLPSSYVQEKVLLGIDIYQYSQYPNIEQIYIPVVFDRLYFLTVSNIISGENYLFDKYGKNWRISKRIL